MTLPGVFAPISDSKMLARLAGAHAAPGSRMLDLCAGSGIVAITAALGGADATAVDVSRRALATVRLNALLNGVRIRALRGSLLGAVEGERFDVIAANPPYVPSEDDELPAAGNERGWDAGRSGRVLLDGICRDAAGHLNPGGVLLVVHSSLIGVERTLELLGESGLSAEVLERRLGPLGPLMRERADLLERRGMLAPGVREEEIVVVRGRLPARKHGKSGIVAPRALARS